VILVTTELKDLELDEVSLVGKAANGRKYILIKSEKGVKMIDNKATESSVALSKADITEIVEKAVEPIRKENAELRAVLRKKEYETIAKSAFSHLGTPEEGAEILKSLEGLPSEARKPILKALKQANAMKAEASKILYSPMGSNRPAPGSSAAQFEELVQKHMGIIEKSDKAPTDRKVLRSLAVAKATKENGALAQAVMAEERANTIKAQMGVL
jgi:hypothetical protein